MAIDSPQEWWSSVNLSTDRIIPHFQNLADAMHKHGAKIMIQITPVSYTHLTLPTICSV